jgi:hypothetical protein
MNNNFNKPELKRSMAKDHETHEKDRQEMIAKMAPSERSKYYVDPWKDYIVLSEDNLKGTTFISKDEQNYRVSIDISRGNGELPKADKNIFFVLGIPLNMKCKWWVTPETERSMAKIHFEEIRTDKR